MSQKEKGTDLLAKSSFSVLSWESPDSFPKNMFFEHFHHIQVYGFMFAVHVWGKHRKKNP
jgi:hypothetical protein